MYLGDGNSDIKPWSSRLGVEASGQPLDTRKKHKMVKNSNNQPRTRTEQQRRRNTLRKRITTFGTWNVQGLSNKLNEVIHELSRFKIDVAAITETKRKGQGSENLGKYDLFFSGVSKECRAQQGVSLMVHRRLRKHITSWEAVSERIIKMNLTLRGHRITVMGVYAVNDDTLVHLKDNFFEQLNEEIVKVGKARELVLLGDFNSRVGKRDRDMVVGRYGEEVINDNGERLIDLCTQNGLKILNGFYPHKSVHKFTWIQETRGLKSIIDYAILRQDSKLKTQDIKVQRGASCGSDHYLLRTYIVFPGRTVGEASSKDKDTCIEILERKYNLKGLEDETTQGLYKFRLDSKLDDQEFENINQHYEYIKKCIHEAAFEALGVYNQQNQKRKPYWWNKEIEEDIARKSRLHQKYLSSKKLEDKLEFKKVQAEVRRKICKEKNESWERTCRRIDSSLGGSRSSESWKVIRQLRNNRGKDIISTIRPHDWEEYFEKLLTEDRDKFGGRLEPEHQNINVIGSPVRLNIEEIERVCKTLKNGKAAGPGDIPGELLKCGTDKLFEHLKNLFQKCVNEHSTPEEWRISYVSTIYKKGDRTKCENYRGIAVTSSVSRVYGKVLKNRIESEYGQIEAEEQAGFRAGRSTTDHIFTLTQVIEKKTAKNQEVHLLFVDLKKAYDSVPLVKLWQTLERSSVNVELIRAVKSLYYQPITKIKIGKKVTPGFVPTKGLRQGCCMSPTLFKIYLEEVLRRWKNKCKHMGIPLTDYTLYTLCFADDQVVVAQDYDDLNYMARKLVEEYSEWGLDVNFEKTEYMCIGGAQQDLVIADGTLIKNCQKYKYLGVEISQEGTLDSAIRERNAAGRRAIGMLNSIIWDRNIRKENKVKIYNSIVKSTITYSAEVWPLKDRTEKMLRATEMDYWRRAAGRSRRERVTNERIREVMGVTHTIVDDIRRRQLVWYGHVRRMPEGRIPKQILDWQPRGRRRRGRPRRSWREGIDREIREREIEEDLWSDRQRWRLEIGKRRRTL